MRLDCGLCPDWNTFEGTSDEWLAVCSDCHEHGGNARELRDDMLRMWNNLFWGDLPSNDSLGERNAIHT